MTKAPIDSAHPLVRETQGIDPRSGKPFVVEITSKFVRVRLKGTREVYSLTYEQFYNHAAMIRAASDRPDRNRQIHRGVV